MPGENAAMKLARERGLTTLEDDEIVFGLNEKPLIQIYCSCSELIPTVKHGNITAGPVTVKRYIEVEDMADLKKEIVYTQSICEEALAEDRETVYASTGGIRS